MRAWREGGPVRDPLGSVGLGWRPIPFLIGEHPHFCSGWQIQKNGADFLEDFEHNSARSRELIGLKRTRGVTGDHGVLSLALDLVGLQSSSVRNAGVGWTP